MIVKQDTKKKRLRRYYYYYPSKTAPNFIQTPVQWVPGLFSRGEAAGE